MHLYSADSNDTEVHSSHVFKGKKRWKKHTFNNMQRVLSLFQFSILGIPLGRYEYSYGVFNSI